MYSCFLELLSPYDDKGEMKLTKIDTLRRIIKTLRKITIVVAVLVISVCILWAIQLFFFY